jgi:hypothetical protein
MITPGIRQMSHRLLSKDDRCTMREGTRSGHTTAKRAAAGESASVRTRFLRKRGFVRSGYLREPGADLVLGACPRPGYDIGRERVRLGRAVLDQGGGQDDAARGVLRLRIVDAVAQ